MTQDWLIYLVGVSALFASRAFLPAFMAGLALRFPEHLPFVEVEVTGEMAAWITSDAGLAILGVLSALEIAADKNPDIRDFMNQIDMWLKAALAAIMNYQVIQTEQGRIIFGVQEAGPIVTGAAVASAVPVAGLARLRGEALEFLRDIDPDNDIGLVSLASWMEDLWVFLGVIFLIVLPVIALIMILLGVVMVAAFDLYLRAREKGRMLPCPACGEKIQPYALRCRACKHEIERPAGVGALGQPTTDFVTDRAVHQMKLLSVKRCTGCGERLKERRLPQTCGSCGEQAPPAPEDIRRYVDAMGGRLSRAIVITLFVGLIPVVGAVFSVIYTRTTLVRPWRQYLSRGRGIFLKWMARFAVLLLIVISGVPFAGLIACPLIAVISYHVWKSGFQESYGLV